MDWEHQKYYSYTYAYGPIDPLLVSRAWRSTVAVRGKCRTIKLLFGAVSMHPPGV